MALKIFLCVALAAVTYTSAFSLSDLNPFGHSGEKTNPDRPGQQNVSDMIKSQGYPVQEYKVTTEDGYILDLIRIPYGIKPSPYRHLKPYPKYELYKGSESRSAWEQPSDEDDQGVPQSEEEGDINDAQRQHGDEDKIVLKRAVLLVADLLSNSEDFVLTGQFQGLAFLLADYGFDVYIANMRGSRYGLGHTTLNAQHDASFWFFGIKQMGVKDLPAIVDKVSEISRRRTISYVGHMLGSTAFYVMCVKKPEYNRKIESMVSLGPVAYLANTKNKVLKQVSQHLNDQQWISDNLGPRHYSPSEQLMRYSKSECMSIHSDLRSAMCRSDFFLLTGYNSNQINRTSMMQLIYKNPSTTSAKEIVELAFMAKTGRFGECVYLNDSPDCVIRDYDLKKVMAPVSIIAASQDSMLSRQDLNKLISELGNVRYIEKNNYDNSLDLLHGDYVTYVVTPAVVRMLISY